MADAPDPGDAKDSAKDDTAPAAATPPDQGSAMELELSTLRTGSGSTTGSSAATS